MQVNALPDTVLSHIFEFLRLPDIMRGPALAQRRFQRITQTLTVPQDLCLEHLLAAPPGTALRFSRRLRRLCLHAHTSRGVAAVASNTKLLRALVKRMGGLREVVADARHLALLQYTLKKHADRLTRVHLLNAVASDFPGDLLEALLVVGGAKPQGSLRLLTIPLTIRRHPRTRAFLVPSSAEAHLMRTLCLLTAENPELRLNIRHNLPSFAPPSAPSAAGKVETAISEADVWQVFSRAVDLAVSERIGETGAQDILPGLSHLESLTVYGVSSGAVATGSATGSAPLERFLPVDRPGHPSALRYLSVVGAERPASPSAMSSYEREGRLWRTLEQYAALQFLSLRSLPALLGFGRFLGRAVTADSAVPGRSLRTIRLGALWASTRERVCGLVHTEVSECLQILRSAGAATAPARPPSVDLRLHLARNPDRVRVRVRPVDRNSEHLVYLPRERRFFVSVLLAWGACHARDSGEEESLVRTMLREEEAGVLRPSAALLEALRGQPRQCQEEALQIAERALLPLFGTLWHLHLALRERRVIHYVRVALHVTTPEAYRMAPRLDIPLADHCFSSSSSSPSPSPFPSLASASGGREATQTKIHNYFFYSLRPPHVSSTV